MHQRSCGSLQQRRTCLGDYLCKRLGERGGRNGLQLSKIQVSQYLQDFAYMLILQLLKVMVAADKNLVKTVVCLVIVIFSSCKGWLEVCILIWHHQSRKFTLVSDCLGSQQLHVDKHLSCLYKTTFMFCSPLSLNSFIPLSISNDLIHQLFSRRGCQRM